MHVPFFHQNGRQKMVAGVPPLFRLRNQSPQLYRLCTSLNLAPLHSHRGHMKLQLHNTTYTIKQDNIHLRLTETMYGH